MAKGQRQGYLSLWPLFLIPSLGFIEYKRIFVSVLHLVPPQEHRDFPTQHSISSCKYEMMILCDKYY